MPLSLPIEPEATKLLHDSPLALLLGMLLDQQQPMEKAFSSPYVLKQRLGRDLDAREIAAFDPEALETIFATPPALHRFPRAFAKRAQELCQMLVETATTATRPGCGPRRTVGTRWPGSASCPDSASRSRRSSWRCWPSSSALQPEGWREATGVYGEEGSLRSVADITDEGSLAKVREYKKAMKAAAKAGD